MIVSSIFKSTFSGVFAKRILGISLLTLLASTPLQAEPIKAVLQVPLTTVETAPMAELAAASIETDQVFVKPSERWMDEEVINQLELRLNDEQESPLLDQANADTKILRGVAAR